MANKDMPRGFRPVGEVKQVVVMKSGSACYPGDFVTLADDGQVDPSAAAADILGLCLDYASGAGVKVRVSCAPEQLYEGQADEAEINEQTDIGQTVDILGTSGSSTYKTSRQEIDSSSIGASQQLVILGLNPTVDNALGAQAKVIVKINQHQAFGTDDFAGV
jgi:hypothetical protein